MSTVGEQTAAEQRLVEYCEGTRLSVNPWDIEAVLDARDTVESERDLLAAQYEVRHVRWPCTTARLLGPWPGESSLDGIDS